MEYFVRSTRLARKKAGKKAVQIWKAVECRRGADVATGLPVAQRALFAPLTLA
jgi:hypothetical protein